MKVSEPDGEGTFAGVRGNDEVAPFPGIRLPRPDPAKAEDSLRTALAIAREQGTRGYELRAATSLAGPGRARDGRGA